MDISTLLPSSDNLYKFLFMGGVLLITFSFIYPLEKQQRIELDINDYNKEVKLLNRDIAELNTNASELKKRSKLTEIEIIKLQKHLDSNRIHQIKNLQADFNRQFDSIQLQYRQARTKSIILDSQKNRINILQSHVKSFSVFRWVMLVIGSLFTLFGIYHWFRVTRLSENFQKREMESKLRS